MLARLRAVFVLDNAQSPSQLRPLLSVGPACAIIITGRQPVRALEEADCLDLPPLAEPGALKLLAHVVDADRIRTEVAAVRHIATLCERLPLMLRVVGGALANRDYWSFAYDAERLAEARERLTQLQHENVAIDASVWLGYAEELSRVPGCVGFRGRLDRNGHRWFSSEVFEATDEENQTDGREPEHGTRRAIAQGRC